MIKSKLYKSRISTKLFLQRYCTSTFQLINGLRSSVLLKDDWDPDVLGCSVTEPSPISGTELVDPCDIL